MNTQKCWTKRMSNVVCALALALPASLPMAAATLYSQPADPSNSGAWTSQTANGRSGFNQAFDDFKIAGGGVISQVSWQGWLSPSFTNVNGFTISIYANNFDNSGSPGALGTLLYSNSVTGNANETAVGSTGGFGIFSFNTAITPFTAAANTTYWLSIVADPTGGDYRWAFANTGDGYFNSYDGTYVTQIGDPQNSPVDLAFTLSNPAATTPEPSGLILAGTGLLGAAGIVRRRLVSR